MKERPRGTNIPRLADELTHPATRCSSGGRLQIRQGARWWDRRNRCDLGIGLQDPVAAGALDLVQRTVGPAQHRLKARLTGLQRAEADADGEANQLLALAEPQAFDRGTQPLRQRQGTSCRAAGEQNRELFATKARYCVAAARNRQQYATEGTQCAIAQRMPPGVVQLFEVVEIHHQQREWRIVAGSELNLALNHLLKGAAVMQACKGIESRLFVQAALGLGDVHANEAEAKHRDADHREIVRS